MFGTIVLLVLLIAINICKTKTSPFIINNLKLCAKSKQSCVVLAFKYDVGFQKSLRQSFYVRLFQMKNTIGF